MMIGIVKKTGIISSIKYGARNYHKRILDHYENPRNVGSLNKNDKNVGSGMVGAPACGDVMKLDIKVNPKTNIRHKKTIAN